MLTSVTNPEAWTVTARTVWLVPALLCAACAGDEDPADLLITGGTVYDGSGGPGVVGNVVLRGGAVAYVGPDALPAHDTVDVVGLAVAPGFIDVHSHTVPGLVDSRRRLNEGVIRQGVTTVVGGPDGRFTPDRIRVLSEAFRSGGMGTNVAFYVGHNGIRADVMGEDQQRPPTDEELETMRARVREGMELGAVGLSTGLMYEPGMFSRTEEVVALAEEVAPFGGIYDSHVRNPVHDLLGSDQEVITIAESAGIPGKIGHLKAVGLHNEGAIRQVIALVERARDRGVDIVSDQYPYDGAATATLTDIVVVPPELSSLARILASEGGESTAYLSALKQALTDPMARTRLRDASEEGVDGGFAWLKATGYGSMRITSSADFPGLVGLYLSEIADARRIPPFDAVAELILGAGEPVRLTLGAIREHDVRNLMVQPWNMIASDGGYADGSDSPEGHPRSAGTFPRLLGHYVRDEGVLSLEEAIRKITSLPAGFLGLEGRGTLAAGAAADVTVFDADRIIDRSDWKHPQRFAEGLVHVWVNGVQVLADGKMTGEAPGRVLTRGSGS